MRGGALKKTCCCGCILAFCCCFTCGGQTNTTGSLFSCTPLQLRPLTAEGSEPQSTFAPPPFQLQEPSAETQQPTSFLAGKNQHQLEVQPDLFELDSLSTPESRRIYRRLDEEGFFARQPVRPENLIDRTLNSIFVPEVVHFRKMTVSCSAYTAIKRRNPLCLKIGRA